MSRLKFQTSFCRFTMAITSIVIIAVFATYLYGCTPKVGSDNSYSESGFPLSEVPTHHITSSDVQESGVNFSYREVEPTDNPNVYGQLYESAESLDDLFAMTAFAVCGEVTDIREYETTSTYFNGQVISYFSGVEFKVEKCFGGKKDLSGKTINISYGVSQHRSFDDCYISLEKDGKYYLFLLYAKDCYVGKEHMNEFIKDFPYVLPQTVEHIIEEYKTGWNTAIIDEIAAGTFDLSSIQKRPKKMSSTEHVENIINKNLNKMRGLTPVQLAIEKSEHNNNQD